MKGSVKKKSDYVSESVTFLNAKGTIVPLLYNFSFGVNPDIWVTGYICYKNFFYNEENCSSLI